MKKLVVIMVAVLGLAALANGAIINEAAYPGGDFANTSATPTPLGDYIGCPGLCTETINGAISSAGSVFPDDPEDAFWFYTGGIAGLTVALTSSAQPFSGVIDLYSPIGNEIGSYAFNGNLAAGFDLLSAWGLGTSDSTVDLPPGLYVIEVDGVFPGPDTLVSYSFDITAAPEPGTYLLVGLGLAGLAVMRRRRAA